MTAQPRIRRAWALMIVLAVSATVFGLGALLQSAHRASAPRLAGPGSKAEAQSGPRSLAPQAGNSASPAAAAGIIISGEPLLVTDAQPTALALVDGWAAPAARSGLEQQVLAARSQFSAAPGGPFTFDAAVLATRERAPGASSATVDAWCVEVLFRQGDPVSELFLTERLAFVWWQGGWRLTSLSETSGPSVVAAGVPTPPAEAAGALSGFVPAGWGGR